jgi:type IV pilus assembly protein PilE
MNHRAIDARRSARGFTLIELMVTIAIVAILSSVAIPMYSDYVRRGSLPEAFTNIADYRVKMEQYYQDNRNYGAAACADVAGGPSWKTFVPVNNKYFTYACAITAAGQGYTLTATGKGSTSADGHVYTATESAPQGTTTFRGVAVVGRACFLSRGDEC